MIKLYDYQDLAYYKLKETFKSVQRALIVMASGLGKTIVSAFITKDELEFGNRGLFLCHENDILEQALKEYRLVLGKSAILKTFYGSSKDWRADNADVLFASFQSFSKWHQAFDETHFDFIIVDESHHGQAPTYKEVIEYFKPKKLLGMTATPNRGDEQDIREIFGEEIVNYSLEESIVNGWLTNVEYRILHDGISTKKLKQIMHSVLEEGERISVKQLNENIFIKMRDEEIAKIILSYNAHKTIIFCENIDHVDNFAKHLPDSAVFHSKLSSKHNQKILKEFKEGKQSFILSVNKFNEGIDVPEAEMIVFLRCTDSETIFRQQLGRGLRKAVNKKKVIVLDFVANVNRLQFLNEMVDKINQFAKKTDLNLSKKKFFVEGESYNLTFDSQLVDLLEVLNRLKADFYSTWEEASNAAISLRIKSQRDYKRNYKKDSRLVSHPVQYYSAFPGWRVFLGGENKEFYPTWKEASRAAIGMNIKNCYEYKDNYKKDIHLSANPYQVYSDFPGWKIFLESKYLTWQEASKAAIDLNIKVSTDYPKKFGMDVKLPSNPSFFYSDFPGWRIFLGDENKEFYSTWQEASKQAIQMGLRLRVDYVSNYKLDKKLPSSPNKVYSDFPGWRVFLGDEKKEFYPTWQEASRVAIELGIISKRAYKTNYKRVKKLPGNPNTFYSDFPGWKIFLGK